MIDAPAVNARQMAQIDDLMRDRYGIEPIQLMEHAGFNVATFTRMLFRNHDALDQQVVVLAGSGGNGGDALVVARFLRSWGADVTVVLSKPVEALKGLAERHARTLGSLRVPLVDGAAIDALPAASVIVDGLLGFGAKDAPQGATAKLIELANLSPAYVLALDVPSGMNATTGKTHDPCILANGTVTLGLPKTGLMKRDAANFTGSLVLVDIGIPADAYGEIGVSVPAGLFSQSWLLPLRESVTPWSGGLIGH